MTSADSVTHCCKHQCQYDEDERETACLTSSDQVWFGVVPALIIILYYIQTCWLLTQK